MQKICYLYRGAAPHLRISPNEVLPRPIPEETCQLFRTDFACEVA